MVARKKVKKPAIKSAYRPALCDQVKAYFDAPLQPGEPLRTLSGFARLKEINRSSLNNWRRLHPEFAAVCLYNSEQQINSQHFLPNKGGNLTLYRQEFCQQLIDYFTVEPYRKEMTVHPKTGLEYLTKVANDMPTFAGFASQIGVSILTLINWQKARPEFAHAAEQARTLCEHFMVTNMLAGIYDPRSAMFIAKNYTGLRDVQEFRDITPDQPNETPEQIQQRIDELDKKIEMLKAQI